MTYINFKLDIDADGSIALVTWDAPDRSMNVIDDKATEDPLVERVAGRVPVELSGGITLANVAAYAAAGPDRISIGALTHSVPAVPLHLRTTATG
jgi:nicotinate-nucleotide pyrophosphorylase (carboxylating)